jgi:hypothetical protein
MGHPQAAGCGVITHDTGCMGSGDGAGNRSEPVRYKGRGRRL